jgi:beta-phosphoglucomutase-like phosphatase (HAD superfamily)
MSGSLKAVVFDWAGTMVDFGSRAPMGVFVEAFATSPRPAARWAGPSATTSPR